MTAKRKFATDLFCQWTTLSNNLQPCKSGNSNRIQTDRKINFDDRIDTRLMRRPLWLAEQRIGLSDRKWLVQVSLIHHLRHIV